MRWWVVLLYVCALGCGRVEFDPQELPCLEDSFDGSELSPQWTITDPASPITIEQVDGSLVFTVPTELVTALNAVHSRLLYDLTGAQIVVVENENVVGVGVRGGVALNIAPDEIVSYEFDSKVRRFHHVQGVDANRVVTLVDASDALKMRHYIRIRHDAERNMMFGATSTDGIEWYETPGILLDHAPTAVAIELEAGRGTSMNSTPGRMSIESVTLAGPRSATRPDGLVNPTACEPVIPDADTPVHIFNVYCDPPNTEPAPTLTADHLCARSGLGPAVGEVHGYGWYQCGGMADRCPGSWRGTACPDWSTGADCTGVPFPDSTIHEKVGDGATTFNAQEWGAGCIGYNPGWTVLARCSLDL